MTADERVQAKAAMEAADNDVDSAAGAVEALRDGPMGGSVSLRAAAANLRDARANLSLVIDGLRFP